MFTWQTYQEFIVDANQGPSVLKALYNAQEKIAKYVNATGDLRRGCPLYKMKEAIESYSLEARTPIEKHEMLAVIYKKIEVAGERARTCLQYFDALAFELDEEDKE